MTLRLRILESINCACFFIKSEQAFTFAVMIERITRSFESQSMMKTLGAMIHKVEKGNIIIEAPILLSTAGLCPCRTYFLHWRQCRRIFCLDAVA